MHSDEPFHRDGGKVDDGGKCGQHLHKTDHLQLFFLLVKITFNCFFLWKSPSIVFFCWWKKTEQKMFGHLANWHGWVEPGQKFEKVKFYTFALWKDYLQLYVCWLWSKDCHHETGEIMIDQYVTLLWTRKIVFCMFFVLFIVITRWSFKKHILEMTCFFKVTLNQYASRHPEGHRQAGGEDQTDRG